jgi:cytochrome P450 family 628
MIANVSFGIEQLQELVCLPHICKISRNFSDSMQQALQNYMLKINSSITMLLSELDTSQPIDISTFFENSAFELMASLVFSENFHTHSRSEISSVLKTLHTNQQLLIGLGHVPWIWTFQAWFPFLVPSAVKFRAFAAETINRRRKTMPEVPDLFSYLSQAEDSGNPTFPVDWEARLAMVAGR